MNELYIYINPDARENVVYFPGDVQTYTSEMMQSDDAEFVAYSYESTALILKDRFPDANVIIVAPCKMYRGTFSCYSNFTYCDTYGAVPAYDYCDACLHLEKLLVSSKVRDSLPLVLVGFSKGAVVLNQIVTESRWELLSKINSMYWLDSGNGSLEKAFPRENIQALSSISIYLYATSYQLTSPRRPWIATEFQEFSTSLSEKNVVCKVHR